jgi:hypothetical protein
MSLEQVKSKTKRMIRSKEIASGKTPRNDEFIDRFFTVEQ